MNNNLKIRGIVFNSPGTGRGFKWCEVHQRRDGQFVVAMLHGRATFCERPFEFVQRFRREKNGRPGSLPDFAKVVATCRTIDEAMTEVFSYESNWLVNEAEVRDIGVESSFQFGGVEHYTMLASMRRFDRVPCPEVILEAVTSYSDDFEIAGGFFEEIPDYAVEKTKRIAKIYETSFANSSPA